MACRLLQLGWHMPIKKFNRKKPEPVTVCHDPRISSDREHKVETSNPALILAEIARAMFPERMIDWEQIKSDADACDQPADRPGVHLAIRCNSCGHRGTKATPHGICCEVCNSFDLNFGGVEITKSGERKPL
jgi:hypothetical protein